MTLPSSGAISLSDLAAEFNVTAPYNLTDFYRGGANVPDIAANSGIPTSGPINFTDFYDGLGTYGTLTDWGTTTFSASLNVFVFSTAKAVTVVGSGTCIASITTANEAEFKVNSGAYSNADKVVTNGDQITLKMRTANTNSTPTSVVVTLTGGDTASWTVYTQDP